MHRSWPGRASFPATASFACSRCAFGSAYDGSRPGTSDGAPGSAEPAMTAKLPQHSLPMRPLAEMPESVRRGIRFVLLDIDDTLTTDGRLTAAAYAALERLSQRGLRVIPVTGRPAGWCDMIARFWPVDAVIGENGAFYFRYDHQARTLTRRFWLADKAR